MDICSIVQAGRLCLFDLAFADAGEHTQVFCAHRLRCSHVQVQLFDMREMGGQDLPWRPAQISPFSAHDFSEVEIDKTRHGIDQTCENVAHLITSIAFHGILIPDDRNFHVDRRHFGYR